MRIPRLGLALFCVLELAGASWMALTDRWSWATFCALSAVSFAWLANIHRPGCFPVQERTR